MAELLKSKIIMMKLLTNWDLKDETLADEISEDEVPKNEASENTENTENTENAMEYNQGDADWDNESVSEEESEEIE